MVLDTVIQLLKLSYLINTLQNFDCKGNFVLKVGAVRILTVTSDAGLSYGISISISISTSHLLQP